MSAQAWQELLDNHRELLDFASPLANHGRLLRATGLVLEASGLQLPVGSLCRVTQRNAGRGGPSIEAEVVGFDDGRLFLMPTSETTGLAPGALVTPIEAFARYQETSAWVWEHQALTRARYCAGDAQVGAQFEEILANLRALRELTREKHFERARPGAFAPVGFKVYVREVGDLDPVSELAQRSLSGAPVVILRGEAKVGELVRARITGVRGGVDLEATL